MILGVSGAGAITQTSGSIHAGTLQVSASGVVSLLEADNNIGSISSASANGFSLIDTGGLLINGAVNGGTGLTSIRRPA